MKSKAPPRFRSESDEARFWDKHGLAGYFDDPADDISLDQELRQVIVEGRRHRRMQPLSIKLDSAYIQAIKRVATQKDIPYQMLIRQWLADALKRELKIA